VREESSASEICIQISDTPASNIGRVYIGHDYLSSNPRQLFQRAHELKSAAVKPCTKVDTRVPLRGTESILLLWAGQDLTVVFVSAESRSRRPGRQRRNPDIRRSSSPPLRAEA
jgi:hypothetical protein